MVIPISDVLMIEEQVYIGSGTRGALGVLGVPVPLQNFTAAGALFTSSEQ